MRGCRFFFGALMTTLLAGATASAEPYRRLVNFEWEPIEGATAYDLEVHQKKENGQVFQFRIPDAAWNGRLAPGPYEMRVRALDYRKVPGDWSPASPFDVALESTRLVNPPQQAAVKGASATESPVDFKWEPVGGAVRYEVEINADDGSFQKKEETTATAYKAALPVAHPYSWKVSAIGEDGVKSETVSMGQFRLVGAKIAKPTIEKPENEFVRDIKWKKPENASKFDVTLLRLDAKKKQWEKVEELKDVEGDSAPFESKWTGGIYRVELKAKGNLRVSSDPVSETFKVRGGDRSPAAEFNAEVRKSVDRFNGWYGIASYLITMIQYSSADFDPIAPSGVSYSAIGGTGRIGAGWFKEERPWGFLGVLDLSGFVNNEGRNLTYTSSELSAVWRRPVGERGEVRVQMGGFYKEVQVARGDVSTKAVSYENASFMGPHVAGEYWYSVTPKLGFQANAHFYLSAVKVKTPNGEPIEPTLSNQVGILGSYRMSKRFTGLIGYARREDRVRYKSNAANPNYSGSTNEATLTGNYLNFFAEYAF